MLKHGPCFLHHHVPVHTFHVYTDASMNGLGALLFQERLNTSTKEKQLIPLLAEYEFEVVHIPGDQNIFSDYISRCGGTVNVYCDLPKIKMNYVQAKNSERFCRILANIQFWTKNVDNFMKIRKMREHIFS